MFLIAFPFCLNPSSIAIKPFLNFIISSISALSDLLTDKHQ
jgi:hypothetical protein